AVADGDQLGKSIPIGCLEDRDGLASPAGFPGGMAFPWQGISQFLAGGESFLSREKLVRASLASSANGLAPGRSPHRHPVSPFRIRCRTAQRKPAAARWSTSLKFWSDQTRPAGPSGRAWS